MGGGEVGRGVVEEGSKQTTWPLYIISPVLGDQPSIGSYTQPLILMRGDFKTQLPIDLRSVWFWAVVIV